jgi:hypothetical protein
MIWNIIDHRRRPYRWRTINAIIEPTYHDNSAADSDQVEEAPEDFLVYDKRKNICVADAIQWAESLNFAVTLYLYDQGSSTS